MANGFKALRHVGGGVTRYASYEIADNQTDIIYNGAMVTLANGKIDLAGTADGNAIVGTFVGCMYVDNTGAQKFSAFWPGSAATPNATEIQGLVIEDRSTSYAVEDGTAGLTVGAPCDLDDTTNAAGSTKTGQSSATVTTNANSNFVVKSIVDANNNIVEVVPNNV